MKLRLLMVAKGDRVARNSSVEARFPFLDDDVTAFFSPHAAGKSVMFLMAVGARRSRAR